MNLYGFIHILSTVFYYGLSVPYFILTCRYMADCVDCRSSISMGTYRRIHSFRLPIPYTDIYTTFMDLYFFCHLISGVIYTALIPYSYIKGILICTMPVLGTKYGYYVVERICMVLFYIINCFLSVLWFIIDMVRVFIQFTNFFMKHMYYGITVIPWYMDNDDILFKGDVFISQSCRDIPINKRSCFYFLYKNKKLVILRCSHRYIDDDNIRTLLYKTCTCPFCNKNIFSVNSIERRLPYVVMKYKEAKKYSKIHLEKICPITFKELNNKHDIIILPCNHIFSKTEMNITWFNSNRKCALCSRKF